MKRETYLFAGATGILVLGLTVAFLFSSNTTIVIGALLLTALFMWLLQPTLDGLAFYLLIVIIGPLIDVVSGSAGETREGLLSLPLWSPLLGGLAVLYLKSFLLIL